jgi:hypothetical protein
VSSVSTLLLLPASEVGGSPAVDIAQPPSGGSGGRWPIAIETRPSTEIKLHFYSLLSAWRAEVSMELLT